MRNLIVGILIGVILTALSGVAYARAKGLVLVNGSSVEVGTFSNPLYVQSI